jgi:hypothetical protein
MSTDSSEIIVHFGAPAKPEQEVSPELLEKGLRLLRLSPDSVSWSGGPTIIQPNFSIYKDHLAAFMSCAAGEISSITKSTSPFQLVPNSDLLPLQSPLICVSFGYPLPDEVADNLRKNMGFYDSVIRGKPAMISKSVTMDTITYLKEIKVLMTTPCIENTINLSAYRQLLFINQLLSSFLHLHQYPAFLDRDHAKEFMSLAQIQIGGGRKKTPAPVGDVVMEEGMIFVQVTWSWVLRRLLTSP